MRKKIIAGNWKMHKTVSEAVAVAKELREVLPKDIVCDVLLCAPYVSLYAMIEVLKGSPIVVGAQNMYFEEKGAFTGEIAPHMLKSIGCEYVIIGHSERRQIFGETDELINKKLQAAFAAKITPILCVGESLELREAGKEILFTEGQLKDDLVGLSKEEVASMVIAYEPIWAIGTGRTATSAQAEEMCAAIRKYISVLYDEQTAEAVRIQYGGSVKGENAKEILSQPNIDGALVGGASLTVDGFLPIIKG